PPAHAATLFPYTTLFRSAHAFGTGDDVGDDFPVLDTEPVPASAAEAGLHFVGDEESAVFFDRVEYDLEIFGRRRDESSDALNGRSEQHTSELQSRGHLVC